MASSAWHIDQMAPPYRSDVWAWAQSSVRWWHELRAGAGAGSSHEHDAQSAELEIQKAPYPVKLATSDSADTLRCSSIDTCIIHLYVMRGSVHL